MSVLTVSRFQKWDFIRGSSQNQATNVNKPPWPQDRLARAVLMKVTSPQAGAFQRLRSKN